MSAPFDKRLAVVLGLIAALLVVSAIVSYQHTRTLHRTAAWVAHTHEVSAELEKLLSLVQAAETGQRGYLITRNERFLAPYHDAVAEVGEQLEKVEALVENNSVQQARMPALRELVVSRLTALDRAIELQKEEGPDAARQAVVTYRDEGMMDRMRSSIDVMQQTEREFLEHRVERHERAYFVAILSILLTTLLALMAIGGFVWMLHSYLLTRAQAAQAVQEQKELLQTTLASIGDGVIATDTAGRITLLNWVAQSLTGWSEDEARNRPLEDVYQILNEQARHSVENPALRAMQGGTIIGLANHTLLVSRDGTERPIDDSAAPIQGGAGGLKGAVLVFRDVTERRERENRLRTSEAEFRAIFETAAAGIAQVDPETKRFVRVNDRYCEITGYSREELLQMTFAELDHPDDREGDVAGFVQAMQAEPPIYRVQKRYVRKDSEIVWVEVAVSLVRDADGKPLRTVAIVYDITDRKQTEQELEQANRRKDEFLAMLGHELRNPLAAIRGGVSLLRTPGIAEAVQDSTKDILVQQTDHMVRLVDDLLDVSRILRGKVEIRKQCVILQSTLEEAIFVAGPAIEANRCRLEKALPPEPIRVYADPVRLTQVFGNLLDNAAKYAPDGQIEVRAEAIDGEAVVRVRDSGIGIEPDLLERMFDLFVQSERSLARQEGGLGIGLTVVKSLVEMQGGRVEAFSEGRGRGSEFVVRLPLAG
jgi:PAS domain S-box-containing protein